MVQVLTEEEYLTLNGAGAYLDVCLHEPGWGQLPMTEVTGM